MSTPNTPRQVLAQLYQDFSGNSEVQSKIAGYLKALPVVTPEAYLVEFDEQIGAAFEPKRHVFLDEPVGLYLDCSTPLYKEAGVHGAGVTELIRAAREVISWTEAAHRPPVRDELEHGRSAAVRLHALADLREALLAFEVPSLVSGLIPQPEAPLSEVVERKEDAVDTASEDTGLFEMTYFFERMGYVGMERLRRTLKEMGAQEGEKPGTVVINLEMPTHLGLSSPANGKGDL